MFFKGKRRKSLPQNEKKSGRRPKTELSWLERTLHMREVTGSSPVVPTKKMSAMVGALFLCGKDENLQPPKKAEINEKPLSAVGSRGRRVRGMPACRSISMPRRTRAPARSRVKSDIGIRQKRAKPRSCEAEMHQQGTSKTLRGFGGVLLSPPRRRKAHFETA